MKLVYESLAAVCGVTALVYGATAQNNHNETVRAESAANVYQQQGDYAQAAQWEAIADDNREDRAVNLGLTVLNLSLVGLNGFVAIAARNKRREEQQT